MSLDSNCKNYDRDSSASHSFIPSKPNKKYSNHEAELNNNLKIWKKKCNMSSVDILDGHQENKMKKKVSLKAKRHSVNNLQINTTHKNQNKENIKDNLR